MKSSAFNMIPETNGKEARISKSQMKTVLIMFLDIKGVVHFEFIPKAN
jgi:hypothetical protein